MFAKQWKITKKDIQWCRQTICFLGTLLLYYILKVLMTSYQLPWQHPRSTKRPSKCQFLWNIWKTNSVTYCFYFFVEKLPKLLTFSGSMKKIYLVERNISLKNALYGLLKILLDKFPWNFYVGSAIVNDACMQKIKIGHRANFRAQYTCFPQMLFPVHAILRSTNFQCTDFNTDSADPCILVMACVDCARACI